MILRDLFQSVDAATVIARAIYEDHCRPENINGWMTKYYAQFVRLRDSKVRKSDYMLYMNVFLDDEDEYGEEVLSSIDGFSYEDIKADEECFLGIEGLHYKNYASLYVPDYSIQRYGMEVVAGEALREYGWNGYDTSIECPDEMRIAILKALDDMESGLFLIDENYFNRCRMQFVNAHEGKEVPQWEDAKSAPGVGDNRNNSFCAVLLNSEIDG